MVPDGEVFTVVDGYWILNRDIAERSSAGVRLVDGRYISGATQ